MRLCADIGITASVEVRAKQVGSLVKKIHTKAYADPWAEITDKVGARIIVHSLAEVERIQAALFSATAEDLECRDLHNRADLADVEELFYPGVHGQVTVPGASTTDGEPIEAELQLRTRAQDVWAIASHKLDYKGAIKPGRVTRRRIRRLSVLIEMFDEEVGQAMNEVAADPAYVSALLLQSAEALYLQFVGEPGEDELSIEVIDVLRPALSVDDSPGQYDEVLKAFVSANEAKLRAIYERYGVYTEFAEQFAYWLFTQPESLIAFQLIDTSPMLLSSAVAGTEIQGVVAHLYAAWGKAMPEPT